MAIARDYAMHIDLVTYRKTQQANSKGSKRYLTENEERMAYGRFEINSALRKMTNIFRYLGNVPKDRKGDDNKHYGLGLKCGRFAWFTLREIASEMPRSYLDRAWCDDDIVNLMYYDFKGREILEATLNIYIEHKNRYQFAKAMWRNPSSTAAGDFARQDTTGKKLFRRNRPRYEPIQECGWTCAPSVESQIL